MANLPDAWVEDARNLDNAEQLLHSAHGILVETPAIGDFLRNETNKRIVVAPKGYGKTFLLKSKRILLQRNLENLSCLPDNQLVDATRQPEPVASRPAAFRRLCVLVPDLVGRVDGQCRQEQREVPPTGPG